MTFSTEFPHSFGDALKMVRKVLSANHELVKKGVVETESEQIVAAAYRTVSGKLLTRAEILFRHGDPIPPEVGKKALIFAMSRAEGKLLQHVTGVQVFLGHEYEVGPSVLVPRPETEVLAARAIELLGKLTQPPRLGIEIGVGSGVLSIELLAHFSGLMMLASELTEEAETCAMKNARKILGVDADTRLTVLRAREALSVWQPFEQRGIRGTADFVISNPPYLLQADSIEKDVLTQEPATALFAPVGDPLHFYREVAQHGKEYLRPGGFVFLEMPTERAGLIGDLFRKHGWNPEIVPDLAQRQRVLVGRQH